MAVIRDVMPAFQLFQPSSIADAQKLLEQHGRDAWVMAGGLDSFDWLKDRIKKPKALVDLSGIEELRGVRTTSDGIEIGAMTTLTEVVHHPVVKEKYGLLAQAAELVASPQIRNQGTLGGNVSQDARCWYYRAGWPCYRAGGNICYADTPVGRNREHAILHAERCVAVNPSDSAPALIALDAKFVVQTPKGERVVDAENYFVGPEIDITRMNILQPGYLLTAIRIPSTWAGAQFYFEKVRDRNVWDFPLMNVASAMVLSGDRIERIRIAVNAAAARPLRLKAVEDAVRGQSAKRRNRRDGGQAGGAGCHPAAVQRLQDSADAQPGEARHQRSAGGSMGFIEWATSPLGQNVPIHIAWFLIWVALIAGMLFLVVHAIYIRYFAKEKEFAADTSPKIASQLPARIPRHSLTARLFHWIMAASMFTLLFTAFLPKLGMQFDWVTYHWIAGSVLTVSIIFHIIHASFYLDFWSIWPDRADLEDAWKRVQRFMGKSSALPRKFAKYPLENKLYHGAIIVTGLSVIVTGVFMMSRVRTIFFPRNPYLFSDMTWGLMYVLHGLAGVGLITLVIVHVYFAVRPEKLPITASMIVGTMSRDFYLKEHDPERWVVEPSASSPTGRQG